MAPALLLLLVAVAGVCQGQWLSGKTNCGVSVWSVWSPTDSSGNRMRTRTVIRQPRGGGTPCPPLSETDSDPWVPATVPEKARKMDSVYGPTILPRDFLFIVDMSGSISSSDFALGNENLAILIGKICGSIGPNNDNNRAAVITFSSNAAEIFDFDDYTNLADLQNAVRSLTRDGGSTCTGSALQLAETMFEANKGARPDHMSKKEVVLLTDGGSNCGPDAIPAAAALRNSRSPPLSLFVFAISNFTAVERVEMDSIAGLSAGAVSGHLFHFISFLEFKDVVEFIVTNVPNSCAPIEVKR